MADMTALHPVRPAGDIDDEFADALAGNGDALLRSDSRRGLIGLATTQIFRLAEIGKTELVGNIAGIAGLVRGVTSQVENFGVEPFAGYARQAAELVDGLHNNIAEKSVEALIDDGRALVRQQPAIAIAAAVIAGFLASRLVKARS